MQRNEDLTDLGTIGKADMTISDLSSGGLLVAEQEKQFLRIAIKNSVFMKYMYSTTMKNPTLELSKLTTMGRVMHPGVESQALTQAQRSTPGFDKVTFTSFEGRAEIHWPRQMLEDQIERGGVASTFLTYMGEHISADMDDICIVGDDTSSDDWLALSDGALEAATSNVYPAGSVSLDKNVLEELIETRPEEFDNDMAYGGDQAFYTNRRARHDYINSLGDRATLLGDTIIEGRYGKELGYQGIPMRLIPRFPNNWNPGSSSTNVLYGNMKQFTIAWQRRMTMDREFRISPQVYVVVMTMRFALGYRHEPCLAKATEITGS